MEPKLLNNIPFQVDMPALIKAMRVKPDSDYALSLKKLAEEAEAIGRPKALYKLAFIEEKGDNYVIIDQFKFTSRILRVNLDQAQRVFCYVATCGMELEEWSQHFDDLLQHFWAEAINEMALRSALNFLEDHLTQQFSLGNSSTMNPGSLPDWPIGEQRPLFALLGQTQEALGVRLTDSLLMVPTKSVSGIRFPLEESFASCQLCPRENCPNRRAPYDQELFEKKYRLLASTS